MSTKIDNSIYADNAATTSLDPRVFEAMKPYFTGFYGNASQPYSFSGTARNALKDARRIIADCIGAKEEEIYFTSGGTESDNWAIKSVLASKDNRSGVLVSKIEHHAILNSAESLKRFGIPIGYLDVTDEGIVLPETLRKHIEQETKLVSVMLANNEIGTIEPIRDLAEIAHKNGSVFHTDAVQAMGHIDVNVNDLGVDMLSASAHKFNGPKGIGFLYVHNGVQIDPFMDGGAQENRLRAGTENVPSIVGMATALKINYDELVSFKRKMNELEALLIDRLHSYSLDFVRNGSENHLPGSISLSFRNSDGDMILHRMDLMGICISTGSACDSKNTQISHVIDAIGVSKDYARGTIRISLGKNKTQEQIEKISLALKKIILRE